MERIVVANLVEGMRFDALTRTGHTVVMDASPEVGGTDMGARPYDLLLVGLAGCTGMDVISILRKKRQDVTRFWVEVEAERSQEFPKVYTQVVVRYHVAGRALDRSAVERAIELSETKYCAASATLRPAVPIRSEYVVYEESANA